MHSKNWQSRTVARSTPHLLNTPEPARIIKSGASPDSHPMGIYGHLPAGPPFFFPTWYEGKPSESEAKTRIRACGTLRSKESTETSTWRLMSMAIRSSSPQKIMPRVQAMLLCQVKLRYKTIIDYCSEGWQHEITWTARTSFSNF